MEKMEEIMGINKVSYRRNNCFPSPFPLLSLSFLSPSLLPLKSNNTHSLSERTLFTFCKPFHYERSNMKRYISGVGEREYKGEWDENEM